MRLTMALVMVGVAGCGGDAENKKNAEFKADVRKAVECYRRLVAKNPDALGRNDGAYAVEDAKKAMRFSKPSRETAMVFDKLESLANIAAAWNQLRDRHQMDLDRRLINDIIKTVEAELDTIK